MCFKAAKRGIDLMFRQKFLLSPGIGKGQGKPQVPWNYLLKASVLRVKHGSQNTLGLTTKQGGLNCVLFSFSVY